MTKYSRLCLCRVFFVYPGTSCPLWLACGFPKQPHWSYSLYALNIKCYVLWANSHSRRRGSPKTFNVSLYPEQFVISVLITLWIGIDNRTHFSYPRVMKLKDRNTFRRFSAENMQGVNFLRTICKFSALIYIYIYVDQWFSVIHVMLETKVFF